MNEFNRSRRRFIAESASTMGILGLAGCNSQDGSDQRAEGASNSGTEVGMVSNDSGNHFDPHVLRIDPGQTVTWKLKGGSHTTTAYASENDKPQRIPDTAEGWDSGMISENGATFDHTFETEGVYDYYCAPHIASGMLGTIVVGDPDLQNQPGMADPQSELPEEARKKIQELNNSVQSGGQSGGSGDGHTH